MEDSEESFRIYIPLKLPSNKEVSSIDKSYLYELGNYNLKFDKLIHGCALTISPFETKKAAIDFFSSIEASIYWVLLKNKTGIIFPTKIRDAVFYDKPIKPTISPLKELIDSSDRYSIAGFYSAYQTVVMPMEKGMLRTEANPTVISGIGVDVLVDSLKESMQLPSLENVIKHEKLKLAIDLYSASHFEATNNAKFITIVSALEALTPEFRVSEVTENAINEVNSVLRKKRKDLKVGSKALADIQLLQTRLGLLKKDSIGNNMRNYIHSIVESNKDLGDPILVSNIIEEIYDTRSILLHQGRGNEDKIKEGLEFLSEFMPKLLEKLFIAEAEINTD